MTLISLGNNYIPKIVAVEQQLTIFDLLPLKGLVGFDTHPVFMETFFDINIILNGRDGSIDTVPCLYSHIYHYVRRYINEIIT